LLIPVIYLFLWQDSKNHGHPTYLFEQEYRRMEVQGGLDINVRPSINYIKKKRVAVWLNW
jgi:hypothetical protein